MRKNIGICVTGYNWEYESRVVDGVRKACMDADINVLVFAPMIHKVEDYQKHDMAINLLIGENEIFNLINYNLLDGIVILGDSITDPAKIDEISQKARANGVPVVNVNDPAHKTQYNIELNETRAMEYVMRHLITEHGCRKINFIGGFVGNPQTEDRLAAYKKVLSEHGIPIDEKRISYGQFWSPAAQCTEDFLAYDTPDAIVCASDTMAFFSMDVLKEHGLSVPKDIIVTGFDDIADCEVYSPSLTSVRRDFTKAGETAVDIIRRVWSGENVPEIVPVESCLVPRCSCGCGTPEPVVGFYNTKYSAMNSYKEFNSLLLDMNTNLVDAVTEEELYECTLKTAKYFRMKRMYICICQTIRELRTDLNTLTNSTRTGLSDTMASMVKFGHDVPSGTEFSTKKLLPDDVLESAEPVMMAFTPLYYKERFLGYMAFEPSRIEGRGELFATWTNCISSNAGSFYLKNELRYIAGRLSDLYVRDPLTDLYNRRGLETMGEKLFKKILSCSEDLTVICADVDCLKPINDRFGHEAGDNAITQTANAIKSAIPADALCARTGGDEFTIYLKCSALEATEYLSEIENALREYNSSSGLEYKVECSCGTYSAKLDEMSAENILRLADEEMYRVKRARKTIRE